MDKKRAPLKRKLIGYIIFLLIIANIGLGIPSYLLAREELEKKGQVILSNAVHMAINEIEIMALNVEAGAITLEDAQERVKSTLIGPETADGKRLLNTPIDLGDNGYFLAYNDQGYEVMHPTIEGDYVYDVVTPDSKQKLIVQEQLRIGRTGGFFDYNWYYPNKDEIGRKLSYAKYEPNWGWTIVATAYASDFNESAIRITTLMAGIFILTVIFAFIFTNNYINQLLQPIFSIIDSMKLLNVNKMIKAKEPSQNDELLDLVTGYNLMLESLEHNMNSLKNREKELKKLAYIDELSGLPNMNIMDQYVERQIRKNNFSAYFVLIDIKELKTINSMYGLSFGDDVIRSVSKNLQEHMPSKGSFITRLTGNEFALWIPSIEEKTLLKWIETTSDYWNQAFYTKRFEVHVDFTISYVEINEEDQSFESILQKANISLQYAKTRELDTVRYTPEIFQEFEHESVLKLHAEKGLNKNEFYPVYQEKVDIHTDKVHGVEALARWHSDKLGHVSPGEFIPIFNKTKLILDLTEKMIDYVLFDYEKLMSKYQPDVTVSINISPLFFMSEHFVSYILEKAAEYKVPTHCIILEITEDVLMDNLELVNKKVNALRQAGFKISLDDFGSGYSSLSYLQKIALDEVKIDKSLIDDIVTDDSAQRMLHSIVEVIQNWGYKSVAEGVETLEQVQIVKNAGCNLIQGYYYSKPEKLI